MKAVTLSVCLLITAGLLSPPTASGQKPRQATAEKGEGGSVIFIHPDGSGAGMWTALRLLDRGPDGETEWDRLSHMGLYRSHQRNSASTTSHAGATAHAYGVKVDRDTYGSVPTKPVRSLSGHDFSIMREAMHKGMAVAVINSGHLCEPGTGVFLASAFSRYAMDSITVQLVESGADVILSGGEIYLLPEGTVGRHGQPGRRKDGRNVVELARRLGYTVVFTRDELLSLPLDVKKVFGVFAAKHTFNDLTEEELADVRLPLYNADVPTIAEMTQATLKLFEHQKRRFLIVAEEEGSDNFANHNNASGAIEALRRADEAIGVARRYVETHPRVLLVTAADSDAGSMGIWSFDDLSKVADPLPAATDTGGALDGQEGTATPPFLSAPDASGRRLPFGIAWSGSEDMSGTVIARAHGFNAGYLGVNVDNTDIYRLMYRTLFGALPD